VVYKFGGSSVRDAERMREVAAIICAEAVSHHLPVVVLSAMGKTTNNLLAAGDQALLCASGSRVAGCDALQAVRKLHLDACADLALPPPAVAEVEQLLTQLEQLLTGISLMQELTPRTSANLVSFGERLSTRIFAAHLRARGVAAQQHDSFGALGVLTTDDFGNGDVLPATYDNVARALQPPPAAAQVAVVTGFLGRAVTSGAITTLGRGGSDLTATVMGRALGCAEVWVWKDVDGVLSADPRIVPQAVPVPFLTYEEATELAYFGAQVLHPQAMQPAVGASSELHVRVKNSYNRDAPGTLITRSRDMEGCLLTSIVRKGHVTMLDVVSHRMLGQHGFLARVFAVMEQQEVSVDVVATSEVSVSVTLDPAKLWSRGLVQSELERLQAGLSGLGTVTLSPDIAVLSLIGNLGRSNELLERVFRALGRADVRVKMLSQAANRCNISLLVDDAVADGESLSATRGDACVGADTLAPTSTSVRQTLCARCMPSFGPRRPLG
jgi:aspartate kinase